MDGLDYGHTCAKLSCSSWCFAAGLMANIFCADLGGGGMWTGLISGKIVLLAVESIIKLDKLNDVRSNLL